MVIAVLYTQLPTPGRRGRRLLTGRINPPLAGFFVSEQEITRRLKGSQGSFYNSFEISHFIRHQFALISSQTAFDKAFLSLEIFNRAHHTEVEFWKKKKISQLMWNIIPPSNRYKKMTAINNATNNIVRMVAKNTTIPSLVAEQMSTKFIATIASVRNTPSSLNRHGNTFQGVIASSTATQPGAIKNIHSTAAQQITAAKTPLYNPLNRHGNTFQGVIASSTGTQPGAIKNIHSTAAQQITAAKTPLYNPLNRHGNTFQGVIASSTATQPGAIKNIHSTAGSAIDKTSAPPTNDVTLIKVVDYMSDRVNEDSYNQTHEYATLSDELNTSTECELDEYLFDSYPLFGDTPKDSPNESSPYTEELKIPNKPFNPLNYTLTYMQPDEVVYTEAPPVRTE
ncbi:hypothetical protein [Pantoea stewartii]|uniref:hypothetical protein n=1 Tax=Pantoea stewartii TaxID=66269 RepID=UPI001245FAAF|nr:hypothetical protein [Pantoea stewartii]KAB0545337.1 hypothetical protein F7Q90_25280 [Pantoea stewartii subsp. stewartii]